MFVLSFKNGNNDPTKNSFDEYYISLVEIKDFNTLIDNKPFFDQPVKNKQEQYEKTIEMSRNNGYTTRNFCRLFVSSKYYNFIGIDLSRQTNTSIPQHVNLTRN